MKKRNRTMLLAAFASLFLLAQTACKTDPINCQDDKVGDVFFEQTTRDLLPLDGKKALIFKAADGSEMRFSCPEPRIERIRVNVEKLCESTSALAFKHKQVDADLIELKYSTASSIAPVQFELRAITNNAILKSEDETAFYDFFSASLFNGTDGSEMLFLVSERDSKSQDLAEIRTAQKFRSVADTSFLGKNFKDLLAGGLISGSDPASKTAFFYQKKVGPAAFSLPDGRVFVFDRAE